MGGSMPGASDDPNTGGEGQASSSPLPTFGKYQPFASLGRGGMADVFLAVAHGQMGFNKLAVIKRLRAGLADEAAFRQMFLDEARLAARVNHPNVVHTYEVGEQDGVYFIAMEYLEGQPLNKVVREASRRGERLHPALSARIVADALAGLGYAHELRDYDGRPLGIIHRDVSPHNIFVTYDGHTKLVDFGVAKATLSSTETEVGVLKGKISYMSPEQAMGAPLDARSDVFAMGIVLWELLTQRRLMGGENAANTLHRLINEPVPTVSSVVPDVDPALEAICARALEKAPDGRWASASAMRDALETWLASQPWPVREDAVGRQMTEFFAKVREDAQKHVQRHMAMLTSAVNTEELRALTAESIRRLEQSGANISEQLLRLGPGSGSGAVANYVMSSQVSAGGASSLPDDKAKRRRRVLALAAGFFVLATLLVVAFGMREGGDAGGKGPSASSAVPVPVSEPTGPTPYVAEAVTPTSYPAAASSPAVTTPPTSSPEPVAEAPTAEARKTTSGPSTKPSTRSGGKPAPATSEGGSGYLTMNVTPWANVLEHGRMICTTPCFKVSMPVGSHTLVLENPERKLRQTTTVVIKRGEVTTRSLALN